VTGDSRDTPSGLEEIIGAAPESPTIVCSDQYVGEFDVLLGLNDACEFLRSVPSKSVRLIISSPPYNIGKPYERREELRSYLHAQKAVLNNVLPAVLELDTQYGAEILNELTA